MIVRIDAEVARTASIVAAFQGRPASELLTAILEGKEKPLPDQYREVKKKLAGEKD